MKILNINEDKSIKDYKKIILICLGNAGIELTRHFDSKKANIKTVAIDTDRQDLYSCNANKKRLIGKTLNNGLGAGGNPEIGEKAAIIDEVKIRRTIENADLIFIVAGLGRGTGTGAYSIILRIAKEKNILTIAIYTMPFAFEGKYRREIACDAAERIAKFADAYIYYENNNFVKMLNKDTSFDYFRINNLMNYLIMSITRMVNDKTEYDNLISNLKNAGNLYFDYAENITNVNLTNTIMKLIQNQLTKIHIENAKSIIITLRADYNLTLKEKHQIIENIKIFISNKDTNIIFKCFVEEGCRNVVSIIIIDKETINAIKNLNVKETINQENNDDLMGKFNSYREKMKNKKIFLSYSHNDIIIADEIDNIIGKKLRDKYYIYRDVRDLKYKGSIRKFMETIPNYNYVLMLISKSYLESENCMYEVLETMRNHDFEKRMLFIILDDANIYDEKLLEKYYEYWNDKHKEKEREIKDYAVKERFDVLRLLDDKRRKIEKIKIDIIDFLRIINDEKGYKYKEMLDQNFKEIISYILKRDKEIYKNE